MVSESDWVWVPFEVDRRYDGLRVDGYLAKRLVGYSRGRVQKILKEARVLRGPQVLKPSARVHGGDRLLIAYPRRPEAPLAPDARIPVLFEDDALVVVNKPADLLSHPTDKIHQHTVLGVLRHCRPDLGRLHLLHRLDRETSGVLALAKSPGSARAWTEAMEDHQIRKEYMALVVGKIAPAQGTIDRPIGRENGEIKVRQAVDVPGAADSVTRFQVLARGADFSLVLAMPETGRLHQIRVHLASIGHPLLGDVLYQGSGAAYLKMTRGESVRDDRVRLGFDRVALHAARLRFPHPSSGRETVVSAPLPDDFRSFLQARGMGRSELIRHAQIDTLTNP